MIYAVFFFSAAAAKIIFQYVYFARQIIPRCHGAFLHLGMAGGKMISVHSGHFPNTFTFQIRGASAPWGHRSKHPWKHQVRLPAVTEVLWIAAEWRGWLWAWRGKICAPHWAWEQRAVAKVHFLCLAPAEGAVLFWYCRRFCSALYLALTVYWLHIHVVQLFNCTEAKKRSCGICQAFLCTPQGDRCLLFWVVLLISLLSGISIATSTFTCDLEYTPKFNELPLSYLSHPLTMVYVSYCKQRWNLFHCRLKLTCFTSQLPKNICITAQAQHCVKLRFLCHETKFL